MYESPIKIYQETSDSFNYNIEKQVLEVTRKYAVDIDEKELEKVLRYDRAQYDKGYHDGLIDGQASNIVYTHWVNNTYCYQCKCFPVEAGTGDFEKFIKQFDYCPHCGAKIIKENNNDEID